MASKKGRSKGGVHRGRGSGLDVRAFNVRMMLAGPSDPILERRLRGNLGFQIYRRLVDPSYGCRVYLNDSGVAAKLAESLAEKVPYQGWKNPRKKTEVVSIVSLDVIYRNPPYKWKWWISVRDDEWVGIRAGDSYE